MQPKWGPRSFPPLQQQMTSKPEGKLLPNHLSFLRRVHFKLTRQLATWALLHDTMMHMMMMMMTAARGETAAPLKRLFPMATPWPLNRVLYNSTHLLICRMSQLRMAPPPMMEMRSGKMSMTRLYPVSQTASKAKKNKIALYCALSYFALRIQYNARIKCVARAELGRAVA